MSARAGVPLGSMTYHFSGIDELLREAFTRFADHIVAVFERCLGSAETPEQVREAVTDLVHALSKGPGVTSSSPTSCTRSPPDGPGTAS